MTSMIKNYKTKYMEENDLKSMVQAFNDLSNLINSTDDVLFITTHMLCSKINEKTIVANQQFYLFVKDFVKQGGMVKYYLTITQLHKELANLHKNIVSAKIQIKNKSYYILRGFCDISNYRKTITSNSPIDHRRKKNCSKGLKRFNELGGVVAIDGKYYSNRNLISYKSI